MDAKIRESAEQHDQSVELIRSEHRKIVLTAQEQQRSKVIEQIDSQYRGLRQPEKRRKQRKSLIYRLE